MTRGDKIRAWGTAAVLVGLGMFYALDEPNPWFGLPFLFLGFYAVFTPEV